MEPLTPLALLLALQLNTFVGSKTCYGCHPSLSRSFAQTAMGRSISPAGDWKPGVLPPNATVVQPGTNRTFRSFHDASGWHQSESEPGVFSVEHPLEYAVGSGANGLTFLVRRGASVFQAPLSYYAKTRKWDLSPGYEHEADLGFNRQAPQECLSCHSGASSEPSAIGCENCHGPGGEHSKAQRPGSIVNPAKLPPRLAENICMNCHQSGAARVLQPGKTYSGFQPGQWLFDTVAILNPATQNKDSDADLLQHYSAMQASRCFRASNGKLGCLTCHDPHSQPGKPAAAAAYYRLKCLTCHTDASCPLPIKARLAKSPPNDCAGCHMPKRSVQQVSHSALTNHRIPAREAEPIPPAPQPETDGLVIINAPAGRAVHLPPVTLLRAYGELSAQNPSYAQLYAALLDTLSKDQDPTVQQALAHRDVLAGKPEEAIAHLELALPLNDPPIYLELAQALAKLGRYEEAIQYLKKGVALHPYNAAMQKTLILQFINTKSYGEAHAALNQYVETFPEDSFMRNMLAKVTK